VLNGLVTNDVSRLTPGAGCYAAALTPKGKVIADLRILARADDFVVDVSAAAAVGWAEVLRKYVNPRFARYEEISGESADFAVAGPAASRIIGTAFDISGDTVDALPSHHHVALPLVGDVQLAVRSPELDVPAWDALVPGADGPRTLAALLEAGAVRAGTETWDVARIARGWPAWGIDMNESTLAQEASLDGLGAISYDKGCYTGQETVARVHFRGHVNRYLRSARFEPDAAIPRGAGLYDREGKLVGDVRSSALTPSAGAAVVMVRREVPESAELTARWGDQSAPIKILPGG
jgi:tRNA-modifying protein YgfZ